jgi:type IV pilus assembly protein PilC
MAVWRYRARDGAGREVQGLLEADSERHALDRLHAAGLHPVGLVRDSGAPGGSRGLLGLFDRVSLRDLALMSRQFSTMVDSGLTLVRSLSILEQQATSPRLRDVLGRVRADVERGSALADALARHPQVFSSLYVNMVRAGEAGGVLDDALERLAAFLEKEFALRQKIRSAMVYPVILAVAATAALLFMTMVIIPQFVMFFRELNVGDLPLPTKVVMSASYLLRAYWFVWIPGLALSVWGFLRWLRTPRGKAWWDRAKLRLPVFGPVIRKALLARFARTLGTLLGAGVPLLQALEVTGRAADSVVVEEAVRRVRAAVREGESIALPLSQVELFPPMVVQMVRVGEEAGNLDGMLAKVADFYDTEVEAAVASLASTLEPAMIVFMGFVVGAMVISLYMPIFQLAAKAG